MIKQLVACMLFSFPFLSATETVVLSERSPKLSNRIITTIGHSTSLAREKLLDKIEEGKESLTTENAFNTLKNTAQHVDKKLDQLPVKTALLYSACIIGVIKFPFIRKSISIIIYPEQIFQQVKKIPNRFKILLTNKARDAKLAQLLKENQKLKQCQPPTLSAQAKEFLVGKPTKELLPRSIDFDGLEHEAVMSEAIPSVFSKLKLT